MYFSTDFHEKRQGKYKHRAAFCFAGNEANLNLSTPQRAEAGTSKITMWSMSEMWTQTETEFPGEELFLAGERVTAGTYRQIGGSREVRFEREDVLPASLDGRVACYLRISAWGQFPQTAVSIRSVETSISA